MNTLTKQQFEQKSGVPDAVVINVLDIEFYNNEHIPGSINIPVDAFDFLEQAQAAAKKDQTVIVYCGGKDCPAAQRAVQKLEEEGFSKVYDYVGGMEEWKATSSPLESNIPGAVDGAEDEEDSATGCGCH